MDADSSRTILLAVFSSLSWDEDDDEDDDDDDDDDEDDDPQIDRELHIFVSDMAHQPTSDEVVDASGSDLRCHVNICTRRLRTEGDFKWVLGNASQLLDVARY